MYGFILCVYMYVCVFPPTKNTKLCHQYCTIHVSNAVDTYTRLSVFELHCSDHSESLRYNSERQDMRRPEVCLNTEQQHI